MKHTLNILVAFALVVMLFAGFFGTKYVRWFYYREECARDGGNIIYCHRPDGSPYPCHCSAWLRDEGDISGPALVVGLFVWMVFRRSKEQEEVP